MQSKNPEIGKRVVESPPCHIRPGDIKSPPHDDSNHEE
jgi:hypothetical protein